jgi:VWFA-related protein
MIRRLDCRLFVALAVLAVGAVSLDGQAPAAPQEPPTPTFRSSVDAVQLTVIVTDKDGKPVDGLTQEDFEVVENNSLRPITTFEVVSIPIERREAELAERDVLSNDGPPGRLYVIALDEMSQLSALRARAFLRQFIEKHFGPNDMAAVVLTTAGPRDSGQEFTNNPRLLIDAINRFGGGFGGAGPMPPDMGDYLREKNFIGDFRNLMRFMSTLRGGRKAMIFVSEGIPADAWQVVNARPARFGGIFSEVDPGWIEALSFATRNNVAVYPVDPRGLTTTLTEAESFDTTELDIRVDLGGLAAVTGGFSLIGSNNYEAAFERLVVENSFHYLIGFNSAIQQRDGRYVKLDVRVKRPGLQVRSIDGYVAPRGRPEELRRPKTVLTATWDAVASAITTSGVPMRLYAAPFKSKGKEKAATVAITVEVTGSKLNLQEEDGAHRGILEVVFAVTDVKNKRWPIWRHRAELRLRPETYERVSNGAIRVLSQLPLPEGKYQVRASAGNAVMAGSVIYDLEIPDFRDDFSLSGVALTSTQARETFTFSPHKQIDVAFPGPPTTAREFSRDDTLTLFTEAYENRKKPHTITLTMELRDEAGGVLGSHVIERKSVDKPREASVHAFAPNLSLEEIPPGRYAVRLEARSSLDRRKSVTREIAFSVR